MIRAQNAHAYVNAGFLLQYKTSGNTRTVQTIRICYGGINPNFIHAVETEKSLIGSSDLYTNEGLQKVVKSLQNEIKPDWVLPDASPDYRKNVAIALFYRFILSTIPTPDRLRGDVKSASEPLQRGLSSGLQSFGTVPLEWPLTKAIPKYEGQIQVSGEALYANDLHSGDSSRELWAAFVVATRVRDKIVQIDATEALVMYCKLQ